MPSKGEGLVFWEALHAYNIVRELAVAVLVEAPWPCVLPA